MTPEEQKRKRLPTFLHLGIEIFFAVLPLFVLGSVWPGHGEKHPEGFLSSPEWSMTACVLYGLALARLQLGATLPSRTTGETRALGLAAISLLPLSGVIGSVILITQFAKGNDSVLLMMIQIANLLCAILIFVVVGGYGISRSIKH